MRRNKVQLQHREDEVLKLKFSLRSEFIKCKLRPLRVFTHHPNYRTEKTYELKHNNELHTVFI